MNQKYTYVHLSLILILGDKCEWFTSGQNLPKI